MTLLRNERDDLILAAKELRRQWLALERMVGKEDLEEALFESELGREFADLMGKTLSGEITPEQAQPEMQHRAGKEAEAKELSQTAELLASDAQQRAAEGISEEDWIDEVRSGYEGDQAAWLRCHEEIMMLRENGPWAWPREGHDRAMGASSS